MVPSDTSNKSGPKQRKLLSAMRPLLKFCRFFGLSPVVFGGEESGTTQIALSRTAEIYTCAFIISAYFGEFLVTRWSLAIKYEPDLILQFDWYFRIVLSILTHVSCWRYRHLAVRSLLEADNFGIEVPQFWTTCYVWFPMLLSSGMVTLLFLAQTNFFPIYNSYLALLKAIMVTMSDIIPALVNILVCSEFTCKVSALRYAIVQFNKEINDIVEKRLQPFPFRRMLRRHQKFREVCSKLNRVYGTSMLLGVVQVFCDATFCIVYSLLTTNAISRTSNLSAFTWGFLVTAPSFIAMQQCQQTENEADRVYFITSRFKEFELYVTYRGQMEAHEWAIQLRQLPIRFTAWGFFDLNGGQVKTIMFTIFSYTVILLQNKYNVKVL